MPALHSFSVGGTFRLSTLLLLLSPLSPLAATDVRSAMVAATGSHGRPEGAMVSHERLSPRRVRYSFTLSNQGNTALTNGTFCVWAPVKHTPTQCCTNIVTSEPAEIVTDELGNQLLVFSAAGIPPYGTKIITIESTLAISPNPDPAASLPSPFAHLAPFVVNSTNSSSPSSRPSPAPQSLGVGGTFDLSTFDSSSSSSSPLTCSEAADLFVSMCISNGIPARRINGYFAPRSTVLRPLRYHSWAEFHDGETWRICDPQRNIFDTNQSDYIPFTILPTASLPSPFAHLAPFVVNSTNSSSVSSSSRLSTFDSSSSSSLSPSSRPLTFDLKTFDSSSSYTRFFWHEGNNLKVKME